MPEFKKINKEPKPPKKKKKKEIPPKTYLFWIKSNKGTNQRAIYELPGDYTKEFLQDSLEEWCSYFAAWEQSICSYGWERIKVLPKEKLNKEWDKICKERTRINEKWDTLRAMFSVRKNL